MGSVLAITKSGETSKIWLPDPKRGGLTVSLKDLDSSSSTRNLSGKLIRDRIAVKREVAYSAPPLTNEEISTLLDAISGVSFTLYYPDPQLGTFNSITAYCGDRSAPAYSYINNEWLWEGLSVTFIEM